MQLYLWLGRDLAQAVSRRPSTAAAPIRARVRSCWIVIDRVALGQVSSEYFGFPCQFAIHLLIHNHYHHLSSEAGIIGQTVAAVPSGLSLTSWEKKNNKKEYIYDYRNLNKTIQTECSSEVLETMYQTTWRQISGDSNLIVLRMVSFQRCWRGRGWRSADLSLGFTDTR
jgi:hypothetical protein